MSDAFTIEEARALLVPSPKFVCKLRDNKYALQFLKFEIKDTSTKEAFYVHEQDALPNSEMLINDDDYDEQVIKSFDAMRTINYSFSRTFLNAKAISSMLIFKVGDLPVHNLTIVDHFFLKNKIIKTFEFNFPFCAPNATNEWEYIYDFPVFEENVKQEMIDNPKQTTSETFFFVDGKIILHNKAHYQFV